MSTDPISLSLEAVIVSVHAEEPRVLSLNRDDGGGLPGIPSGPLDPASDPTLDRALRAWVERQTGLQVGYVEQLYTFGDRDRYGEGTQGIRPISVAYLALVRDERPSVGASWLDLYRLFPWEDHRNGRPTVLGRFVEPALERWAAGSDDRSDRVTMLFGLGTSPWDAVKVLERYELLYEAGLVAESYRDRGVPVGDGIVESRDMALDHRRMAATALGRLRGKLTYRPVVFELLAEEFTLLQLQRTVEALSGMKIHKQNFRRLVERAGLVEGTGSYARSTGGRPAELFRFRREVMLERPRPGVRIAPVGG